MNMTEAILTGRKAGRIDGLMEAASILAKMGNNLKAKQPRHAQRFFEGAIAIRIRVVMNEAEIRQAVKEMNL